MKRDVGKYIKSGGRLIEKYERMGAGGEAVYNGVDSCEGIRDVFAITMCRL